MDAYKTLQTILEKVKDRCDAARYSKDPNDMLRATMDNQERLSEAMIILGAVLQTIIDKQITVTISAPPKDQRN
jgi:hypothetical protein